MNIAWENIVGHKKLIEQLRLMRKEERLPHAMLFCGYGGVGKTLVAEALAASLLCHKPKDGQCCGVCPSCKALAAGTHPDYFQLVPESSTKAAKSIKIDAVRELQASIARVPLLSPRRVVLIQDAEKMNEAAANCLLKTIEEPVGQVTFLLLTSAPTALLDTIISRCMRVEFGILQPGEVREVLLRQGLAEDEAERLSLIADGSVSHALALNDPEILGLWQNALDFALSPQEMNAERLLSLAKEMSAKPKEQLVQWLGFLIMAYRDLLVLYKGSGLPLYNQARFNRLSEAMEKYPSDRLLGLLRLAQEYQRRFASNVNAQLCLEGFFIRLNEMMG